MNPINRLKYLKSFIKLTENEAVERNLLEEFLSSASFGLALDADSLLFNVCYQFLDRDYHKGWMLLEFQKQVEDIRERISLEGLDIERTDYYFTTCKNNFRLQLSKEYKAHRPDNELKKMVTRFKTDVIDFLKYNFETVYLSDKYEADDLIAMNYLRNDVICSIDKDLKPLTGVHFDYLKVKTGEVNEYNRPIKDYKGFTVTTPNKGTELLGALLLIGDASDGIKGVKGIGKVGAKKILLNRSEYGKFRGVIESYIKEGEGWKDKVIMNTKLIDLRHYKS